MKIIIADDEEIIVKWVKKTLEELSKEYHVTAVCSNGKQALEHCRMEKPDILITDICMPVMDGMELLRKLKEEEILPSTIILSAYEDFSYARKCIKYGVSEFLLKSEITKEELENSIKTIEQKYKNVNNIKRLTSAEESEYQKLLLKSLENSQRISLPELRLAWDTLCGIEGEYTVFIIKNEDKNMKKKHMEEMLTFLFQEEKSKWYWLAEDVQRNVLIVETQGKAFSEFIEKICQLVFSFVGSCVRISIGKAGYGSEELQTVYHQALETEKYQEFYQKQGWLDYETLLVEQTKMECCEEQSRRIEQAIKEKDLLKIKEEIEKEFVILEKYKPSLEIVRRDVLNFLLHIFWECMEENERKAFYIDYLIEISNSNTFLEMSQRTINQVDGFFKVLSNRREQYSDTVWKIREYIEENYAQSITLEEIANYVHMNKSYISYLFKKEMGENISEYLLSIRLEKAQNMLRNSKKSIQETANEVGFSELAYFSKVFKKKVGMSPLEFRKQKNDEKRS